MSGNEAFRQSASDLLGQRDQIKRLRALRDTPAGFEREHWQEIAAAGWLSVLVPEARGGLGLGLAEVAGLAEEVGRHLLPEPFVAAGVQVPALLAALPESPEATRLLDAVMAGHTLAGVAWQESLGQLEGGTPATRANAVSGEFVLHGEKRFVVPGTGADGWLVTALTVDGPAIFWVAAGTNGASLSDQRRIDGSIMTTLRLDGARVPASARLAAGSAAARAVDDANDAARIAQGAELLGLARKALALTLDYARTRVQFDRPIGSFQALQHRMADLHTQTEVAAACIDDTLETLAAGRCSLAVAASRIKARCGDVGSVVTRAAIQLHGAIGYTDEHAIGFYWKRAVTLCAWLGGIGAHRARYLALQPATREAAEAEAYGGPFPRDADWAAVPEGEFRAMVRGFLQKHYPPALRYAPRRVRWHEIRDWYLTLARQGWVAPGWPKAFGGMELPPDKLLALFEEFEQFGVARAPDQGITLLGPVLIRFGTHEQQQTYLPRIISGENVWCQGYSEPNSGSDLASLRTEAVLDGDEFVVTGQKIWTTLAQDATHIFMLVRTDKSVRKQAGISFLLVDMKSPGITVRPIRTIAGEEEFCEVFFDQVRVPRANLVGTMNQGWTIAKALLGHERLFIGSPKQPQYTLGQLTRLATSRGLLDDPVFRARYGEFLLEVADLSAAYKHFADMVKRGEALPPGVSMLKIYATETQERLARLLIDAAEEQGAFGGAIDVDGSAMHVMTPMIKTLAATIYAGSNEIQRNILAKGTLDLPG